MISVSLEDNLPKDIIDFAVIPFISGYIYD